MIHCLSTEERNLGSRLLPKDDPIASASQSRTNFSQTRPVLTAQALPKFDVPRFLALSHDKLIFSIAGARVLM